MRKTNLRTPEMHEKYINATKDPDFYENTPSVEDFVHWRIIENSYPYDAIATVHHMLVPRRVFQHPKEMTVEEMLEFSMLENFTLVDTYDFISRNFPANQSAPQRLHYHLLALKEVV